MLADSCQDAHIKLQRICQCFRETGIVLKFKKSWVGVDYLVTQGICKLSDARKAVIASAMTMRASAKETQSFLDAALFSHNHVSNYIVWAAQLYSMTHADQCYPGG